MRTSIRPYVVILLGFVCGGCGIPTLTQANNTGNVTVASDSGLQSLAVVDTVWARGLGIYRSSLHDSVPSFADVSALYSTTVKAPPNRSLTNISEACYRLNRSYLDAQGNGRISYVLSLDPPVIGYVIGKGTMPPGDRRRGRFYPLLGSEEDFEIDGYLICDDHFWETHKNIEVKNIQSLIKQDVRLKARASARQLMEERPWILSLN